MRILERYVLRQLLRVFGLLLVGLTLLLMFVGVVTEASKNGLGVAQIWAILPYVVPGFLPYLIPATLLLTVCVVYGRMSSDHEVTATKAAGISVLAVLWPSFILAGVLSLGTFVLTDQFIPWARSNIERIVTLALEDIFLDRLRTQNAYTDVDSGTAITVMRVEGKKLIKPTIRYSPPGGGTVTVVADEATIKFDMSTQKALIDLYRAQVQTAGGATLWWEHEIIEVPLPVLVADPHPRNLPIREINRELTAISDARDDLEHRQICRLAFALSQGEFEILTLPEFHTLEPKLQKEHQRYCKLHTEIHSRLAMAFSCFFFVLFGSPFSILQSRRQFLTNFFLCFLPILLGYYPLMLLMMNLGKSDILSPVWGVWVANGILLVLAGVMLRKVRQH